MRIPVVTQNVVRIRMRSSILFFHQSLLAQNENTPTVQWNSFVWYKFCICFCCKSISTYMKMLLDLRWINFISIFTCANRIHFLFVLLNSGGCLFFLSFQRTYGVYTMFVYFSGLNRNLWKNDKWMNASADGHCDPLFVFHSYRSIIRSLRA